MFFMFKSKNNTICIAFQKTIIIFASETDLFARKGFYLFNQ